MKSNKTTNLIMNLTLSLTLGALAVVSPSYGESVAMGNETSTVLVLNDTIETKAIPEIKGELETLKEADEKEAKEKAEEAAAEYYDYSYNTNYTASNTAYAATSYNYSTDGGALTPEKGVVYYDGHRETYYSQQVLPGGGLDIPGRHVADDGTVRDADGYICVASSDHSKGTVVETSLGTGKVYDSGCASGTVDIYTNW